MRCISFIEPISTEEALIAATAASIPHSKNGKQIFTGWQRRVISARTPPETAQTAVEYDVLAAQVGAVRHDN